MKRQPQRRLSLRYALSYIAIIAVPIAVTSYLGIVFLARTYERDVILAGVQGLERYRIAVESTVEEFQLIGMQINERIDFQSSYLSRDLMRQQILISQLQAFVATRGFAFQMLLYHRGGGQLYSSESSHTIDT